MNEKELLSLETIDLIKLIKTSGSGKDYDEYLKQYDPEQHDVQDLHLRQNRISKTNEGTKVVNVARLSVPFQKIIVDRAAAFLIGEGIKLLSDSEGEAEDIMMAMIKRCWHETKLDYRTRELARLWMSETECAEYWYLVESENEWSGIDGGEGVNYKMKLEIWAPSKGDRLFPFFNDKGTMIAFGRGYTAGKKEHIDIFTDSQIRKYIKSTSSWELDEQSVNQFEKIPVVYYSREKPEWADVQYLIDRFETMISNYADQNDYFASPILLVDGEVEGFTNKGESGKMLQLSEGADVRYLTWDQAPAAIKTEREILQELIFSMTQTPDISFAQLKGLGNVSGVALRLMFMDAQLKCMKHEEVFGEGLQRRINILKRAMGYINVRAEPADSMIIIPEFEFYMPRNDQELINMLVTATSGKQVMSRKTAVELNPLVLNPEKELEDIKEDEAGDFGSLIGE